MGSCHYLQAMAASSSTTSPFDQAVTFIYVRDLDAATHFYNTTLRLPLALVQRPPNGNRDVVRIFAITGTSFIGLCLVDHTSKDGTGVVTDGVIFTLVTDSVDEWSAKLVQDGIDLEKGPVLNERYNIYHIFFRDPDGHLLEIQEFRDPNWPRVVLQSAPIEYESKATTRANQLFAQIYGDMPYIKVGKGDLTNGEIVSERNMELIFDRIHKHNDNYLFEGSSIKKFYDLGSGIGKPVIASALVCDWLHEFIGIEIQNDLYENSIQARDRYNTLSNQKGDTSNVQFLLGSFFEHQDWVENGDVIFVNSTAFSSSTMKQLIEIAKKCKKGCYIVTLTHNLLDEQGCGRCSSDFFDLVDEFRLEMSWGEADYFVHFKMM